jgi:DNA repair and recombination protein RAD54B
LRKLIFQPEAALENEKPKTSAPNPKSRLDALLSVIDLENIAGLDHDIPRLSVHDVPGGSISFLFEKSSKSAIVSEEDEEDHR